MRNLRIEDTHPDGFVMENKRFQVPSVIKWTCVCEHENGQDLTGDHYLSHPPLGVAFERYLYCEECGDESVVRIKLSLSLALVETV